MNDKDSTQNQTVKRYFELVEIQVTLDCPHKYFHDVTTPKKSQRNFDH